MILKLIILSQILLAVPIWFYSVGKDQIASTAPAIERVSENARYLVSAVQKRGWL